MAVPRTRTRRRKNAQGSSSSTSRAATRRRTTRRRLEGFVRNARLDSDRIKDSRGLSPAERMRPFAREVTGGYAERPGAGRLVPRPEGAKQMPFLLRRQALAPQVPSRAGKTSNRFIWNKNNWPGYTSPLRIPSHREAVQERDRRANLGLKRLSGAVRRGTTARVR